MNRKRLFFNRMYYCAEFVCDSSCLIFYYYFICFTGIVYIYQYNITIFITIPSDWHLIVVLKRVLCPLFYSAGV